MYQTRRIAIYGKGGIGKSSTASNVAAACADDGHSVTIIGCDPKSDSSITLLNGRRIPTVLDLMRQGVKLSPENVIHEGYKGVKCIEVGGPEPGVGCAGRGIIVAVTELQKITTALTASCAAALWRRSERGLLARHTSSRQANTCRFMLQTTSAKDF